MRFWACVLLGCIAHDFAEALSMESPGLTGFFVALAVFFAIGSARKARDE